MQLRKAKSVSRLYDHEAGIGDINANLYNRGRDKQTCFARHEAFHNSIFLGPAHPSVDQCDLIAKTQAQLFRALFGGGKIAFVAFCRGRSLVFLSTRTFFVEQRPGADQWALPVVTGARSGIRMQ